MVNSASNGCLMKVEKKKFRWRIDGFSSLLDKCADHVQSSVFEIKGLHWILNLSPKYKRSDGEEYVCLTLQLSRSSLRYDTVVQAVFKFFVYDQIYRKHAEQQVVHHFETFSPLSEDICMIPLKKLKSLSSGFIFDDSCIFGVEFIKVITVKTTDTTSENLYVQQSNTFDDHGVYTWIIEDFTTPQTPCNSPTFVIGGYKWYLSIRTSNMDVDGSTNFLSLFLHLSDMLPKNHGLLVEVSFSLKDQANGNHRKFKGRCEFSRKAKGCGRGSFILLDDLKDTSKGYIVKGKCCIEAEVSIIGVSTMA